MKLQPIKNRVLVKIEQPEDVTKSGLIIPQTAQQKTDRGEVIAIGTEIDFDVLKAGDIVVYEKFKGTELTIENVKHIILHEDDIIAKEA